MLVVAIFCYTRNQLCATSKSHLQAHGFLLFRNALVACYFVIYMANQSDLSHEIPLANHSFCFWGAPKAVSLKMLL